MGTNFYLEMQFCPCCGRPMAEVHLGKTSNNSFIFHRQPGLQIPEQFKTISKLGVIKDEYGKVISYEIFCKIIDESVHEFFDNDFC